MLIFLSIALLIYGSMHFYAFAKLWQILPHTNTIAILLIIGGTLLTLTPFLVWYLERGGWHRTTYISALLSYNWMGYLFLFVCIGLLADLGQLASDLLHLAWPLAKFHTFLGICLLAAIAFGYGLVEANQIRVERITLHTPKLAAKQLTIAQLSDLHLGNMQGTRFLDRIITKLNELKPDILVATGDIVDGQGDDLNTLARNFSTYRPKLGAYAVTGNHEFYAGLEDSLNFLRNAGFTVLRGETARVGGIVIAGVDDPTATAFTGQAAQSELHYALTDTANDDFILLLKHQPVIDDTTRFDLQLSGHTHGGQIFPFVYLTKLSYHFNTGLTELADGRKLYVSRGTGTWGPPIRLFSPPEITLITLVGTKP